MGNNVLKISKLSTVIFLMFAVSLISSAQSSQNNYEETLRQVEELIAMVPAPSLEKGTTYVNVHFSNLDQKPCSNVTMELFRLISTGQNEFTAEIDPETATASFALQLEGTARCVLKNLVIPFSTDIYLAPGETVDVWCDMTEVVKRDKTIEEVRRLIDETGWTDGDEPVGPPIINYIQVKTNGHYAELNNDVPMLCENSVDISFNERHNPLEAPSSSSDAAASLINDYIQRCRGIIQEPQTDIQKALKLIDLRLNAAAAATYRITDKSDLKNVLDFLNLNDSKLLFGKSLSMSMALYPYRDLIPDSPLITYYENVLSKVIVGSEM